MTDVLPKTDPHYLATLGYQRAASEPSRSVFVSANAGSGKTKVLTDRVARLLLTGVRPQDVLCVTFTKAAAAEMQARLFDRLGKWSVMKDADLVKELAELEDQPEALFSVSRLRQARALFAAALETPGGLRIETLHGFCQRLISRFPLEAGLAPGFAVVEGGDAEALWEDVWTDLLTEARADPALTATLRRVAEAAGGKGLEGAFKEVRHARARVAKWLDAFGGDVEQGLAALKDELGAGPETVEALYAAAVGPGFPVARIRTCLPALFGGSLKTASIAKSLAALLEAIDTDSVRSGQRYLRLFQTASGTWRKSNFYGKGVIEVAPDIASLFQIEKGTGEESERMERLHQAILARLAFDRTEALIRLSVRAMGHLAHLKAARGQVDFDDLIVRAKALLSTASAAQWVLYKLDGRLSHVLVDEAQDNNEDQWAILNALTAEFFSGSGAHEDRDPARPRTLFVVGDPKQSIFGFQGAAPEIFRARLLAVGDSLAQSLSLPMSFRSTPEVLAFVDRVLNVAPPFRPEASTEGLTPPPAIDPHSAHRSGQAGSVELWPPVWQGPSDTGTPWTTPVDRVGKASPAVRLADRIVSEIQAAIARGDIVHERIAGRWTARPVEPRDVLILVRARGSIFHAINRRLKQAGLPIAGTDRFVLGELLCVQDTLNAMRVALCPADDLALAEWLKGPFMGWLDDDQALTHLAAGRRGSLEAALRADTRPQSQAACKALDRLVTLARGGPMQVMTRLLDGPCPQAPSGWQAMAQRFGGLAKEPLQVLLDRAADFDARHGGDIQGFIRAVDQDISDVKREVASQTDAVRVMTVHGAKGLEAPWVILPDTTTVSSKSDALATLPGSEGFVWKAGTLEDLPVLAQIKDAASTASSLESARLLYVGLTRAQDRLTICGTGRADRKAGISEGSWYDACAQAMASLHEEGLAIRLLQDEAAFEPTPKDVTERDFHWYRFGPAPVALDGADAGMVGTVAEDDGIPDWARTMAATEPRALADLAPSALWRRLGSGADDGAGEPPVLPPLDPARQARLERGRVIHLLLERLPDVAIERRAEVTRRYLSGLGALDPAMREEIARSVLALFDDPVIAPFLSAEGRAEVAIAGTGPGLPHGVSINGKIDRLLVTNDHVYALDFKSDRPGAAGVDEIDPGYIAQMAAYRAVLMSLYPQRQVRCALIWTEGARFMDIPAEMMDRCLTSLRESHQDG